jgi:hypothetical protein
VTGYGKRLKFLKNFGFWRWCMFNVLIVSYIMKNEGYKTSKTGTQNVYRRLKSCNHF